MAQSGTVHSSLTLRPTALRTIGCNGPKLRGGRRRHQSSKNAVKWTRLSCHKFRDNAIRLQLHALAYNLANFMRTLALPKEVEHWSLTTLQEKLVKIGAKVVRHGRYVTFQLAEVAVSRDLFQKILSLIDDLRPRPAPA